VFGAVTLLPLAAAARFAEKKVLMIQRRWQLLDGERPSSPAISTQRSDDYWLNLRFKKAATRSFAEGASTRCDLSKPQFSGSLISAHLATWLPIEIDPERHEFSRCNPHRQPG
jgi:hypothetical protein